MNFMLQWAVTSSVLILVVLVLRLLLKEKLSARWRYALWAVVLVRLLVPFSLFPSSFSVSSAIQPVQQNLESWMDDQMIYAVPTQVYPGRENLEDPIIDRTEHTDVYAGTGQEHSYYSGGVVIDQDSTTHYLFMAPLDELVMLVWAAGCVVMLCWLGLVNLRFSSGLRTGRREFSIQNVPIPVYITDGIPSPCLFGLFRPAIYLTPEAAADETVRAHVLAHELTHYAHKDHIWSALRCLALVLHWYNPLVWLAVVLSKRDGELACDEGAVARLGEEQRIPYGRTLVDMVAQRSLRPGDLLSCSTAMTEGKKIIQQRVALLVKKPETKATAIFAACTVLALAAVFVFAGQKEVEGSAYTQYLDQVEQAQSIQFGEPLYSSRIYPDPITSDDLLDEAKSVLRQARDLMTSPPEGLDLSYASVESSCVKLTGTDGDEHIYLLFPQNENVYILAYEETIASDYPVVAVLNSDDLTEALAALAKRQRDRGDYYRDFLSQVEQAQGIQYSPAPISSQAYLDPIVDDDLLEEAKTILETAQRTSRTSSYVDQDMVDGLSPTVTLINHRVQNQYLLYRKDNKTYVVIPTGFGTPSYTPIAELDASPDALASAAQRQWERNQLCSYPLVPTLTARPSDTYQKVYYNFSIYQSYTDKITNSDTIDRIYDLIFREAVNGCLPTAYQPLEISQAITLNFSGGGTSTDLSILLQAGANYDLIATFPEDEDWTEHPFLAPTYQLPAGTVEQIIQAVDDWRAGQPSSAASPSD